MADLKLDIIVVPTYSTLSLGVMDASTYPDSPPISSPSIRITVPGFGDTTLPFDINSFNIYNSGNLCEILRIALCLNNRSYCHQLKR